MFNSNIIFFEMIRFPGWAFLTSTYRFSRNKSIFLNYFKTILKNSNIKFVLKKFIIFIEKLTKYEYEYEKLTLSKK